MIGVTLFVIAVVVTAIWVIVEIRRFKHKLFAIFLIALIIFFYVSAAVVFKGQDIDYKSVSGLMEATRIYFVWLGDIFNNMVGITTHAIKMDWGSGNQTAT